MTQIGGKKHHKSAKKHHVPAVGSRAAVFHGNAKHTSGGLEKKDLKKNKHGSIVSKKASRTAKRKKTINRLRKAGYTAKKGQFKLFKKSSKKRGGLLARRTFRLTGSSNDFNHNGFAFVPP